MFVARLRWRQVLAIFNQILCRMILLLMTPFGIMLPRPAILDFAKKIGLRANFLITPDFWVIHDN